MRYFTQQDLDRISGVVEDLVKQPHLFTPGQLGTLCDVFELTNSHRELTTRFANLKKRRENLGVQLKLINDKQRELRATNKTLNDKLFKKSGTTLKEVLNVAVLENVVNG